MEIPHDVTKQFLDYGRQCVRSDNLTKVGLLVQAYPEYKQLDIIMVSRRRRAARDLPR
jgi:hypothetical protein